MKKLKSNKEKLTKYMATEESDEYWDNHDSSDILLREKKIKLAIARPDYRCTTCGSSRIRKRIIDLPVLEGTVLLKKTKILFCADCKTYIIEKKGLEEIRDTLQRLIIKLDNKTMTRFVREGLASYEKRCTEKTKERKVLSIYFPTKAGHPAKAQISIAISDPLYPKLRVLTSEDVRKLLDLQYCEDLEKEAEKHNRTISQYLRLELAKRI